MKKAHFILVAVLLVGASLLFAGGKSEQASGPVTLKVANYALLEAGYENFWNKVKVDFETKKP